MSPAGTATTRWKPICAISAKPGSAKACARPARYCPPTRSGCTVFHRILNGERVIATAEQMLLHVDSEAGRAAPAPEGDPGAPAPDRAGACRAGVARGRRTGCRATASGDGDGSRLLGFSILRGSLRSHPQDDVVFIRTTSSWRCRPKAGLEGYAQRRAPPCTSICLSYILTVNRSMERHMTQAAKNGGRRLPGRSRTRIARLGAPGHASPITQPDG